jgi:hypothetical protein
MSAEIKKAKLVRGSNILLRDAGVQDAKFIFELRLDPIKGRYLSATSNKLEDQENYLRSYGAKTDQAYFIICAKDMQRLGCIRMYDPIGYSYCWGSWLMISGLSPLVSIESAMLIYSYGKLLGFEEARIDVRKENKFVWYFHEKFFGAERVSETDIDYFYVVRRKTINEMLMKYSKFIPEPLEVIW